LQRSRQTKSLWINGRIMRWLISEPNKWLMVIGRFWQFSFSSCLGGPSCAPVFILPWGT
jgi:hypothetical protein